MTAPPGIAPEPSMTARRADKAAPTEPVDPAFRRRLIDGYCWFVEQQGRRVRRARVREVVDRFLADGRSDLLDTRRDVEDFATWFLTYADPTGEKAVRQVMRGVR